MVYCSQYKVTVTWVHGGGGEQCCLVRIYIIYIVLVQDAIHSVCNLEVNAQCVQVSDLMSPAIHGYIYLVKPTLQLYLHTCTTHSEVSLDQYV